MAIMAVAVGKNHHGPVADVSHWTGSLMPQQTSTPAFSVQYFARIRRSGSLKAGTNTTPEGGTVYLPKLFLMISWVTAEVRMRCFFVIRRRASIIRMGLG